MTTSLTPPPPTQRPTQRSAWEIQRSVVYALYLRELRARIEGRWIGLLWAVFEPLAHLAVVMLLFTFVKHRLTPGIEPSLFLVSGLVPFFMFRNLALRGADAIGHNFALFAYRQVKPFDTVVSRALLEITLHSLNYVAILAFLAWLGIGVWPHQPLELLGMSAVLVSLGFGLGLSLAVLCSDRPRLRSSIGIVFVPLYLLSGVIFPLHGLPAEWLDWLLLNPVLHLMELSRHGFVSSYRMLEGITLAYPAAWALVLCALGMSLYRTQRHRLVAST